MPATTLQPSASTPALKDHKTTGTLSARPARRTPHGPAASVGRPAVQLSPQPTAATTREGGERLYRTSDGSMVELPPDMTHEEAARLEAEAKAAQTKLGKGPPPKPVPDVKKLAKKEEKKQKPKPGAGGQRRDKGRGKAAPKAGGAAPALLKVGPGKVAQYLAAKGTPVLFKGVGMLRKLRQNEQTHDDAAEKLKQSENAVVIPPSEGQSKSNTGQVNTVRSRPAPIADENKAKQKLQKSLTENMPRSIEDVDNFKRDRKAQHTGADVMRVVQGDKNAVLSTFADMEQTPPPVPPEHMPEALPPEEVAPPTANMNLGQGAIAPLQKEHTDLSNYTKEADSKLKEEGITQEQLDMVDSGDLAAANREKKGMDTGAKSEPLAVQKFAQQETANVDRDLKQEEKRERDGLRAKRKANLGATTQRQKGAKSALEKKREEVAGKINGIFTAAQDKVKKKLADLETQSMKRFDDGNAKATKAFEDNVNRELDAYEKDRYSGWFGWARKAKDWLLGMDDLPGVKAIFERNRTAFVNTINGLVEDITADNKRVIQECKDELTKAKQAIKEYVDKLGPDLKDIGKKTAEEMSGKLDELDRFVAKKEQELQDKLKDKQQAAIKAIDEKIEKMKEAMAGALARLGKLLLWAAKKFFTWALGKFGVSLSTIEGIISKGVAVLKAIFTQPIQFVKNLVKAASTGFVNFGKNFLTHLKNAVFEWLTGALEGVTLPQSWDLKGILSVVFQVLGLTYQNIRSHLVKLIPEPVVKTLETTFTLVKTLITDGPMAAWEQLKQIAGEMQEAFIGAVKDWIKWKVVEEAIKTVLAMFIPGAGIIRAIIGIYDTIVFFIQKAKDIMQMIGNFLGSIADIAAGNIGAAATALETGLARGLKLVIDFLARFLRLSGITKRIQGAIQKIRGKVDAVIEKVAQWIVAQARRLGRFVAQVGVPQDPNERLRLALKSATAAVNRFAGKRVGANLLRPLLSAIKLRYHMRLLDVVPRGSRWAVRGIANPAGEMPTEAQTETGAPSDAGNVREQVARALLGALPGEHTQTEVRAAVATVQSQFTTDVVKRIEIGAIDERGSYPILVEASALSPLLLMEVLSERVVVGLVATLRFSKEQTLRTPREFRPTTLQAPNAPSGQFIGAQHAGGITVIRPTPMARLSDPLARPPAEPVRSRTIQAVAYNTASPSQSRGAGSDNDTHAESQFIRWFNSDVDASSIPFLERVELTLTHSPCSLCSRFGTRELLSYIQSVTAAFRAKAGNSPSPVFAIRYQRAFSSGPNATTTDDIAALKGAGYLVVGPAITLSVAGREQRQQERRRATILGQRRLR